MGIVSQFYTFVDGTTSASLITAERLNTNWSTLYTLVNGNLEQENVKSGISFVISAATRPSWSASYAGKILYAQDTQKIWIGNSTTWVEIIAGAHATNHKSGGSDVIALDTLGSPTDITTLDASASAHGLLPKLSNVSTEYLNGVGGWAAPKLDACSAPTDITTLNATTSAHGLCPKGDNNTEHFLRGDMTWSTPLLFTQTAPGSTITITNATERTTDEHSAVTLKEITINEDVSGTLTLECDYKESDNTKTVYMRFLNNSTVLSSTFSKTGSGAEDYSTESYNTTASLASGDKLRVQAWTSGPTGSHTASVQNFVIKYKLTIYKFGSYTLSTALDTTYSTPFSTTNSDPV